MQSGHLCGLSPVERASLATGMGGKISDETELTLEQFARLPLTAGSADEIARFIFDASVFMSAAIDNGASLPSSQNHRTHAAIGGSTEAVGPNSAKT